MPAKRCMLQLITSAMAIAGVVALTAAAASAQPVSAQGRSQASHSVAAPRSSAVTPEAAGRYSATSGTATTQVSSAGDPCFTSWTEIDYSSLGLRQWWIRMTTNWCENGVTVTSHSTRVTQDHGRRWNYYPGSVSFNCYVASGSTRNCSGNHEHLTGVNYLNGALHVTCFPSIAEWENYRGQYLHDWSNNCFPV